MHSFTPKIFGIGLSKTGTTSLYAALQRLGYRAATYQHLRGAHPSGWFNGDFSVDYLTGWDAITDLPIGTYFPDLDRRYPGSKFILTCREIESWLASAERQWGRTAVQRDAFRQKVRLATYGILDFDRERFRFVYQVHERNVRWHFRERPGDLLVMNLGAGDGWPQLCPFLGARAIPNEPFPNAQPGFDLDPKNPPGARKRAASQTAGPR